MDEFRVTLNSRVSGSFAAGCGTIARARDENCHVQVPPQPDRSLCGPPRMALGAQNPETGWLMAKLPWGYPMRLLARVKGLHREPGRSRGVLAGRAASGVNS